MLKRTLAAVVGLAASLTFATSHAAETLRVSAIPDEAPTELIRKFKPLGEYLEQQLGMPVKFTPVSDYAAVVESLASDRLDLAWLGGFTFVQARLKTGDAIPLVQREQDEQFTSKFITADPEVKSLADLKGKTFAFVDPSSTSGHLFPKAGLIKAGFDPDNDFSRVIFSGGHDASAIAVQNGKVDAGAVADALLESAIARGMVKQDEIAIVWKSPPIPGAPFVMRTDLPEPLKKRLRAAFAQQKDLPWGPNATIKRWVPVDDSHFDVVRDTARLLKLDIKKLK